jgi:hypothetical protein
MTLDQVAHGAQHRRDAQHLAESADRRRDAAEALRQQCDCREQSAVHRPDAATDGAKRALESDRIVRVGRVHHVDGGGDAPGRLDRDHDRLHSSEGAGEPSRQKVRQQAHRGTSLRAPPSGHTDALRHHAIIGAQPPQTAPTLRVKGTLAKNYAFPGPSANVLVVGKLRLP